jgi:hypothetical protein
MDVSGGGGHFGPDGSLIAVPLIPVGLRRTVFAQSPVLQIEQWRKAQNEQTIHSCG